MEPKTKRTPAEIGPRETTEEKELQLEADRFRHRKKKK